MNLTIRKGINESISDAIVDVAKSAKVSGVGYKSVQFCGRTLGIAVKKVKDEDPDHVASLARWLVMFRVDDLNFPNPERKTEIEASIDRFLLDASKSIDALFIPTDKRSAPFAGAFPVVGCEKIPGGFGRTGRHRVFVWCICPALRASE